MEGGLISFRSELSHSKIVSFDTTSTKGLTDLIEVIVFQLVKACELKVYLNATTISRCVSVT